MRDLDLNRSFMRHVMPFRTFWPSRPTIPRQLSSHQCVVTRLSRRRLSNDASDNDPQPTIVSEDGSKTLRGRKHENKSLPLPVLMDPVLQEVKQKHHKPKPRQIDTPSQAALEFRRKLRRNVHANALLTTVRQCSVTRARLPIHFLIPFTAEMPNAEDAEESGEGKEAPKAEPKSTGPTLVPAIDISTKGSPSSYLLATKEAVNSTFSRKGKSHVLVNERMKKRYAAHIGQNWEKASADWLDKTRKAWPAEQSVPDTVLAALRRSVVANIAWCAKEEDERIPGGSLMSQTVLGGAEGVEEDDEGKSKSTPPRLLYVENSSSYYNAAGEYVDRPREEMEEVEYDLGKLLGPELCEELKEKHLGEWRDDRAPVLIRHPKSMSTIMTLEKLQNYLDGANG